MRSRSTNSFLLLLLAGCGDNVQPFFEDPAQPLPARLSELGLDDDRVFAYEPAWPLWSSGSEKTRLAVFPAPIDTTVADRWVFPAGTTFIKTFAYGDRPIETRVLRLLDEPTFDVYKWDGNDAYLADLTTKDPVAVDAGTHTIPSRIDCRACHESAAQPVIGFSELQLGDATLAQLDDRGLRTRVNAEPERIPGKTADTLTYQVLGYFTGNCVPCHHTGTGPNNSFDLRYQVALQNTIDHPTESSASAAGIRVVPGDPEQSILWLAFARDTTNPEVKPMPPVGIDRGDAEGIELVRRWIESLPVAPAP